MKTKSRKFPFPLWERVRVRGGISAVPLIIALVFMISLGTFFNSLLLGKHVGAPLLAKTTGALYITEAGIEYTAEYLNDYTDLTLAPDIPTTSFGGGTFAVAFTDKDPVQNSVTATATGTIANAVRGISMNFEKKSVLGSYPVSYISGGITDQGATILCQDGTPCDPTIPLDNPPYTCLCTYQTTMQKAPLPPLPPDAPPLPWPNLSIPTDQPWNYNFAPGTYYFDTLTLTKVGGNDAHVTVSGPVTIWIWTKFEMKNAATFNYLPDVFGNYTIAGDPANVLLLSRSSAEFVLMNTAKFSGGIYAPNGTVELKNSAQLIGAIVGNSVALKNDSQVIFDSDAGGELIAAGSPPPETVIASGWKEI